MKHKILVAFLSASLVFGAVSLASAEDETGSASPAMVQDLGFKFEKGKSRLEIAFDKDVIFEKTVSDADNQVIIDVKNAKIGKKWARRIDTSQHKSNVSLISPYQSGDLVRVVLQLKDGGGVEVTQDGNKVVALIDNKELPAAEPKKEELAADLSNSKSKSEAPDAVKSEETVATNSAPPQPEPTKIESVTSESTVSASGDASDDSLNTFFESQRTKRYVGNRIFLQVADADLTDVFRIISEASEFNIVLGDLKKEKVTLNLADVPWDQALDLVLHSYRLGAERQGNVLRITTLEALTKEKEAEAAAKRATEATEPLVAKIFPISYAKISDLQTILKDFLTKDEATQLATSGSTMVYNSNSGSSTGGIRGSIQIDNRTNSLIIRERPSTIEKIKRIVKELDMPTPQILIEGKFVEVAESNQRDVQGRIFATSREFDSTSNSLVFRNNTNNFGSVFGGGVLGTQSGSTLPTSFAISPVPGASFGFAPKTGIIPGIGELSAFFSILEAESHSKVIASPRVVTQNKEQAEITQGTQFQIAVPAAANTPGGFQQINAVLKLTVTPQVTNEGSISMKIAFSQDVPDPTPVNATFAVNTKKVDTNVLIDSGATLVIGGIYSSTILDQEAGIPVLRNLPIIGNLFGSKGKTERKNELFIFLTPRVINEKETGSKG